MGCVLSNAVAEQLRHAALPADSTWMLSRSHQEAGSEASTVCPELGSLLWGNRKVMRLSHGSCLQKHKTIAYNVVFISHLKIRDCKYYVGINLMSFLRSSSFQERQANLGFVPLGRYR